MAHVAKYTQSQVGHLFNHYNRDKEKDCNRSNESIDKNKTKDNYNLMEREQTPQEYIKQRLNEVYHMNRADINVMVDWIVTLPKDYDGDPREFFQHTVDYLNDRYGADNCIGAFVHMDETTPHLHYSFLPVVPDLKHEKYDYKLDAKKVISRKELREFHPDLQKYLREKMPDRTINIYSDTKEKIKDASLEKYKLEQELEKKNELQRQLKDKEKDQFDTAVSQNQKEKRLNEKQKELDDKEAALNKKIKEHNKRVEEYSDKLNKFQQAKEYFHERDSFIKDIGTNDYTYDREMYLYDQQMPGHEIPTISTYNGTYFLEPELNSPYRTEEERENLQIEFERFLEPEPEHEKEHNREYSR